MAKLSKEEEYAIQSILNNLSAETIEMLYDTEELNGDKPWKAGDLVILKKILKNMTKLEKLIYNINEEESK